MLASGSRPQKKRAYKVICAITICSFLFTSLFGDYAFAQRPKQAEAASTLTIGNLNLPPELGTLMASYKGNAPYTVIHIRDTHCNYAAQKTISKLIEYFRDKYGVSDVYLEGGEGGYDLSVFTDIENPVTRYKVSDYFLTAGEIGGAEFCAIKDPGKVTLFGIEDTDAYLENLYVYRNMLDDKPAIDGYLADMEAAIQKLKNRVYSKELLEVDRKCAPFREGEAGIKDCLKYLYEVSASKKIDISDLANIALLHNSIILEDKIDFKRADMEKDEIVALLQKDLSRNQMEMLVAKALEYKKGDISKREFFRFLIEKASYIDLDLNRFKQFGMYFEYLKLSDAIDKAKVKQEFNEAVARIKDSLYENQDQRELDKLSGDFAILKDMFNIILTKEDYDYFNGHRADFHVRTIAGIINRLSSKYSLDAGLDPSVSQLDGYIEEIMPFYQAADKRDAAFIKNIKSRIEETGAKNAIVITGGFHADNLCGLFKKEGISHVSIIPTYEEKEGYESPYFERLSGKPSPLVEYMMARAGYISPYSPFSEKAGAIYSKKREVGTRDAVKGLAGALESRESEFSLREQSGYEPVAGAVVDGRQVYASTAGAFRVTARPEAESAGAVAPEAAGAMRDIPILTEDVMQALAREAAESLARMPRRTLEKKTRERKSLEDSVIPALEAAFRAKQLDDVIASFEAQKKAREMPLWGREIGRDSLMEWVMYLAEAHKGREAAEDEVQAKIYIAREKFRARPEDSTDRSYEQRKSSDAGFPVLFVGEFYYDTEGNALTREEIEERYGLEDTGKTAWAKVGGGRVIYVDQPLTVVRSRDGLTKAVYFGELRRSEIEGLDDTDIVRYGNAIEFKGTGTTKFIGHDYHPVSRVIEGREEPIVFSLEELGPILDAIVEERAQRTMPFELWQNREGTLAKVREELLKELQVGMEEGAYPEMIHNIAQNVAGRNRDIWAVKQIGEGRYVLYERIKRRGFAGKDGAMLGGRYQLVGGEPAGIVGLKSEQKAKEMERVLRYGWEPAVMIHDVIQLGNYLVRGEIGEDHYKPFGMSIRFRMASPNRTDWVDYWERDKEKGKTPPKQALESTREDWLERTRTLAATMRAFLLEDLVFTGDMMRKGKDLDEEKWALADLGGFMTPEPGKEDHQRAMVITNWFEYMETVQRAVYNRSLIDERSQEFLRALLDTLFWREQDKHYVEKILKDIADYRTEVLARMRRSGAGITDDKNPRGLAKDVTEIIYKYWKLVREEAGRQSESELVASIDVGDDRGVSEKPIAPPAVLERSIGILQGQREAVIVKARASGQWDELSGLDTGVLQERLAEAKKRLSDLKAELEKATAGRPAGAAAAGAIRASVSVLPAADAAGAIQRTVTAAAAKATAGAMQTGVKIPIFRMVGLPRIAEGEKLGDRPELFRGVVDFVRKRQSRLNELPALHQKAIVEYVLSVPVDADNADLEELWRCVLTMDPEGMDEASLRSEVEILRFLVSPEAGRSGMTITSGKHGIALPESITVGSTAYNFNHSEIPGLFSPEVLGEGADGTVFLARSSDGMEGDVAVKMFTPLAAGAGAEELRRALSSDLEILKMRKLSGVAGVPSVYNSMTVEAEGREQAAVVIELAKGKNLHVWLNDLLRDSAEEEARAVVKQVARDLARMLLSTLRGAHSRGLLHMDIKPGNIMIYEIDRGGGKKEYVFKLIDWSRSKYTTPRRGEPLELKLDEFLGTFDFAVERDLAGEVGSDTEVNKVGLVSLWLLLLGKLPPGWQSTMTDDDLAEKLPKWRSDKRSGKGVSPEYHEIDGVVRERGSILDRIVRNPSSVLPGLDESDYAAITGLLGGRFATADEALGAYEAAGAIERPAEIRLKTAGAVDVVGTMAKCDLTTTLRSLGIADTRDFVKGMTERADTEEEASRAIAVLDKLSRSLVGALRSAQKALDARNYADAVKYYKEAEAAYEKLVMTGRGVGSDERFDAVRFALDYVASRIDIDRIVMTRQAARAMIPPRMVTAEEPNPVVPPLLEGFRGTRLDKTGLLSWFEAAYRHQRAAGYKPAEGDPVIRVRLYRTKEGFMRGDAETQFPVLMVENVVSVKGEDLDAGDIFGLEPVPDENGDQVTVYVNYEQMGHRSVFVNQDVTEVWSKDGKLKAVYAGRLNAGELDLEPGDTVEYAFALESKGSGTYAFTGGYYDPEAGRLVPFTARPELIGEPVAVPDGQFQKISATGVGLSGYTSEMNAIEFQEMLKRHGARLLHTIVAVIPLDRYSDKAVPKHAIIIRTRKGLPARLDFVDRDIMIVDPETGKRRVETWDETMTKIRNGLPGDYAERYMPAAFENFTANTEALLATRLVSVEEIMALMGKDRDMLFRFGDLGGLKKAESDREVVEYLAKRLMLLDRVYRATSKDGRSLFGRGLPVDFMKMFLLPLFGNDTQLALKVMTEILISMKKIAPNIEEMEKRGKAVELIVASKAAQIIYDHWKRYSEAAGAVEGVGKAGALQKYDAATEEFRGRVTDGVINIGRTPSDVEKELLARLLAVLNLLAQEDAMEMPAEERIGPVFTEMGMNTESIDLPQYIDVIMTRMDIPEGIDKEEIKEKVLRDMYYFITSTLAATGKHILGQSITVISSYLFMLAKGYGDRAENVDAIIESLKKLKADITILSDYEITYIGRAKSAAIESGAYSSRRFTTPLGDLFLVDQETGRLADPFMALKMEGETSVSGEAVRFFRDRYRFADLKDIIDSMIMDLNRIKESRDEGEVKGLVAGVTAKLAPLETMFRDESAEFCQLAVGGLGQDALYALRGQVAVDRIVRGYDKSKFASFMHDLGNVAMVLGMWSGRLDPGARGLDSDSRLADKIVPLLSASLESGILPNLGRLWESLDALRASGRSIEDAGEEVSGKIRAHVMRLMDQLGLLEQYQEDFFDLVDNQDFSPEQKEGIKTSYAKMISMVSSYARTGTGGLSREEREKHYAYVRADSRQVISKEDLAPELDGLDMVTLKDGTVTKGIKAVGFRDKNGKIHIRFVATKTYLPHLGIMLNLLEELSEEGLVEREKVDVFREYYYDASVARQDTAEGAAVRGILRSAFGGQMQVDPDTGVITGFQWSSTITDTQDDVGIERSREYIESFNKEVLSRIQGADARKLLEQALTRSPAMDSWRMQTVLSIAGDLEREIFGTAGKLETVGPMVDSVKASVDDARAVLDSGMAAEAAGHYSAASGNYLEAVGHYRKAQEAMESFIEQHMAMEPSEEVMASLDSVDSLLGRMEDEAMGTMARGMPEAAGAVQKKDISGLGFEIPGRINQLSDKRQKDLAAFAKDSIITDIETLDKMAEYVTDTSTPQDIRNALWSCLLLSLRPENFKEEGWDRIYELMDRIEGRFFKPAVRMTGAEHRLGKAAEGPIGFEALERDVVISDDMVLSDGVSIGFNPEGKTGSDYKAPVLGTGAQAYVLKALRKTAMPDGRVSEEPAAVKIALRPVRESSDTEEDQMVKQSYYAANIFTIFREYLILRYLEQNDKNGLFIRPGRAWSYKVGDRMYFAFEMEYGEGGNLYDAARLLPGSQAQESLRTLVLMDDVLRGLRIDHGDAKPSNMIFVKNEKGELKLKLIDFGLAEYVPEGMEKAPAAEFEGTHLFMPESGRAFAEHNRAVAATAYLLLTGEMLWTPEEMLELDRLFGEEKMEQFFETRRAAESSRMLELDSSPHGRLIKPFVEMYLREKEVDTGQALDMVGMLRDVRDATADIDMAEIARGIDDDTALAGYRSARARLALIFDNYRKQKKTEIAEAIESSISLVDERIAEAGARQAEYAMLTGEEGLGLEEEFAPEREPGGAGAVAAALQTGGRVLADAGNLGPVSSAAGAVRKIIIRKPTVKRDWPSIVKDKALHELDLGTQRALLEYILSQHEAGRDLNDSALEPLWLCIDRFDPPAEMLEQELTMLQKAFGKTTKRGGIIASRPEFGLQLAREMAAPDGSLIDFKVSKEGVSPIGRGAGGFGGVFLGKRTDREGRERFAVIKFSRQDPAQQIGLMLEYLRGLKVNAPYGAVGTITGGFYTLGEGDFAVSNFFVVTEYMRDGTLEDLGRISDAKTLLSVARHSLQALIDFQNKRFMHLDIKPANLFVVKNEAGEIVDIKLGDFGTSRLIPSGRENLALEEIAHTPGFSPDRYAVEGVCDFNTDLHALAVTLWVLRHGYAEYVDSEGRRRSRAPTVEEIINEINKGRFSVDRLIEVALIAPLLYDVETRFTSAEEALKVVEMLEVVSPVLTQLQMAKDAVGEGDIDLAENYLKRAVASHENVIGRFRGEMEMTEPIEAAIAAIEHNIRAEISEFRQTAGLPAAAGAVAAAPEVAEPAAAGAVNVVIDEASFRLAGHVLPIVRGLLAEKPGVLDDSAEAIFGEGVDITQDVKIKYMFGKQKYMVVANVALKSGKRANIVIYMDMTKEGEWEREGVTGVPAHEAGVLRTLNSNEKAKRYVAKYGTELTSGGRYMYTSEFLEGHRYDDVRSALERVAGIMGIDGYMPGSEGITGKSTDEQVSKAIGKLVELGLIDEKEAAGMSRDELREYARNLLIQLDGKAIEAYFSLYNAMNGKLYIEDVRPENLMATKVGDEWTIRAFDLEGWRLKDTTPAEQIRTFEVFNEGEDGATSGMLVKLYLLRGWYWSRIRDKSGFFDAIVRAFEDKNKGYEFLESARDELLKDTFPSWRNSGQQIDKYLRMTKYAGEPGLMEAPTIGIRRLRPGEMPGAMPAAAGAVEVTLEGQLKSMHDDAVVVAGAINFRSEPRLVAIAVPHEFIMLMTEMKGIASSARKKLKDLFPDLRIEIYDGTEQGLRDLYTKNARFLRQPDAMAFAFMPSTTSAEAATSIKDELGVHYAREDIPVGTTAAILPHVILGLKLLEYEKRGRPADYDFSKLSALMQSIVDDKDLKSKLRDADPESFKAYVDQVLDGVLVIRTQKYNVDERSLWHKFQKDYINSMA